MHYSVQNSSILAYISEWCGYSLSPFKHSPVILWAFKKLKGCKHFYVTEKISKWMIWAMLFFLVVPHCIVSYLYSSKAVSVFEVVFKADGHWSVLVWQCGTAAWYTTACLGNIPYIFSHFGFINNSTQTKKKST